MEVLKTENKTLKNFHKNFSYELNSLKQNSAQNFRCYECTFEMSEKSMLKCHIYDIHAWKRIITVRNQTLLLALGFVLNASTKQNIDMILMVTSGHYEHLAFSCEFCEEMFPIIKDFMMHKKSKYIKNVSFCLNFESN